MERLKCVVIGAPVCGKTSLINTFMSGGYFYGYIPNNVLTRYDVNFICKPDFIRDESLIDESLIPSKEVFYNIKIYDYEIDKSNSSQCLRDDELDQVDVIILCYKSFSKSSKDYLDHNCRKFIESKWPNTPVVLSSCFSDLLGSNLAKSESLEDISILDFDDSSPPVTILPSDQELLYKMGAKKHYYCSSLENFNINKTFKESFKLAIINKLNNEYISNHIELQHSVPIHIETKDTSTVVVASNQKEESKNQHQPEYSSYNSNDPSNSKPFQRSTSQNLIYLNEKIFSTTSISSSFIEPVEINNSCMSSNRLNQNNQINKHIKPWKTALTFVISMFLFGCILIYVFTYQYCHRNKNHCDEIYELSLDAFDDSMTTLNESFVQLIHQFNKFNTKSN